MILAKAPEGAKSSTESDSGNKVPALVPWEEHQRLIDEAAKRASKETIESLRRVEKENDSDTGGGDSDDGEELDFFATKTNKSIKNMVSSVATLKRAFEQPPSQIEQLMYQAFTQKTIENLSGNSEKKKNWYDEILSSVAHGLGQRTPELIDTLTRNFGSEWVKQTATGLLNPGAVINSGGQGGMGGQGGQGQNNRGVGGSGNLNQDAVDQIMALDPNNPAHVSAYAEIQGNIDINDARKMLQIHQDIFMKKMQRNAAQMGDVGGAENVRQNIPPNIPNVPVNSDIPPVWAQAMMGKLLELEKKVNDNIGISNVEHISHVDIGNTSIGKVQTAEEFQRELEEETRREKEKSGMGNVNKWEDDPSVAVGVVSHERRLEEESMRKKPLHDASADMIRREVDIQKEKLEVVTTLENFEEEKVEIPVDINSDIDKIMAEEEVGKEESIVESTNIILVPENETKDTYRKAPKSVLDEPKDVVKETKFAKGSQGWLKAQKEKKV